MTIGMSATWTDPDGAVYQLMSTTATSKTFTQFGIAGWGARPFELVTDPVPRGGETVRFVRAKPARITWPLHIDGDTPSDFWTEYQQIRTAFLKTVNRRLPGTLTVTRPDGALRAIDCYYETGFGGESGEYWTYANPVLTLYAPDGCWRGVSQTVIARSYTPGTSFFSPFPTVSSEQVMGDAPITNSGDVDAWPTWTLVGPFTSLTASNATTGQSFTLTSTIPSGRVVTISTLRPMVRDQYGTNLSGSLNWPDAYLWPLRPGSNDVAFAMTGASTGSAINASFYPRYEGV